MINDFQKNMCIYKDTTSIGFRKSYGERWIEFHNCITDFLNTILHEDSKKLIHEHGRFFGTYVLWDGDYCIRIPGCTLGGIIVDSKNAICGFHINSGYPFRYFNVDTPQALEAMLLARFKGSIITKPIKGIESVIKDIEKQIGMSLPMFFKQIGKSKEYMVTVNNKCFYKATLLGGEFTISGTFVYTVLMHGVGHNPPFISTFDRLYTHEEVEKILKERVRALAEPPENSFIRYHL